MYFLVIPHTFYLLCLFSLVVEDIVECVIVEYADLRNVYIQFIFCLWSWFQMEENEDIGVIENDVKVSL